MNENRIALSKYRLQVGEECIRTAENIIEVGDYKSVANRSYYAMFHCVRSILALEGVDYKKHSAVIGHFQREYVKTRIFDSKFSDYLKVAFRVRGFSDYEDYYVISKQEVEQQVANAKEFYEAVKVYLADRWGTDSA